MRTMHAKLSRARSSTETPTSIRDLLLEHLVKAVKPLPKLLLVMATVIIPEVAADGATNNPDPINAMPMKASKSIPWLWDTAAGRHLIGRQALTPAMKEHLQQSPNPVAFATGGGSQPGQESLAFNGSKILEGEEVYVLKECPPAQSIGKTVIDKGYMFVCGILERMSPT